jgi:hypothetical protein
LLLLCKGRGVQVSLEFGSKVADAEVRDVSRHVGFVKGVGIAEATGGGFLLRGHVIMIVDPCRMTGRGNNVCAARLQWSPPESSSWQLPEGL